MHCCQIQAILNLERKKSAEAARKCLVYVILFTFMKILISSFRFKMALFWHFTCFLVSGELPTSERLIFACQCTAATYRDEIPTIIYVVKTSHFQLREKTIIIHHYYSICQKSVFLEYFNRNNWATNELVWIPCRESFKCRSNKTN